MATPRPPTPSAGSPTATPCSKSPACAPGPPDLAEPPAFQAPYPAFYSYGGDTPGETVLGQFDLFEQLAPTFRAAYESFPFSWVYVTTAQEAMMIYPYRADRRSGQ